ncbi:uncharacterized protein I303_101565 [Kwoniella dejecticola CBS 10117]|uniref:Short-chain dehydrogenase n=1 Tax=Kwoniella dejecticola CBS 10117 TaxID=1296121 RepID=A0A1A6ADG6_9TREE|nr:uncharacterized protein I303_02303 [Kwoniella dejecticola CBS 10117]OBR88084.1 hypothetical protein I303_02303 [Kwoniella dejecticola CBS 10117]
MSETIWENTLSFGKLRLMRQMKFNPLEDIKPSFEGRIILITGASDGIGLQAAIKFAGLGAQKVILGVRSLSKGEEAVQTIERESGVHGICEVWPLDLLQYDSILSFVQKVEDEVERLDIAIMNAGVFSSNDEVSVDGLELDIQVNVVSTILLSILLLPKMLKNRRKDFTPVLEIISSMNSTQFSALAPDGMKDSEGILKWYSQPSQFDKIRQYPLSKLFLEFCHSELSKLVLDNSTGQPLVRIPSVCPGPTKSALARNLPLHLQVASWIFGLLIQQEAEQGARSYIHGIGLGPEAHGKLFSRLEITSPRLKDDQDAEARRKVWEETRAIFDSHPDVAIRVQRAFADIEFMRRPQRV